MIAPARWFIVVNFTIHAMMYTYYGLRAVGLWIPKPIAMTITILQLSQMVVGVFVNSYAYRMKVKNVECEVQRHHLQMGAIMYASYFILFAHFFYKAYFGRNGKRRAAAAAVAVSPTTNMTDNNNVSKDSSQLRNISQRVKVN